MTHGTMIRLFGGAAAAALLTGCTTASLDRSQAQADEGAPEVAEIEPISIAYDANYPTYVVAIEPFKYAASGTTSGGDYREAIGHQSRRDVGPGMSAQLLTALARSGNIQVIEYDSLRKKPDGSYTANLEEGEVGPFIIRGTVTEFNETADASGEEKGMKLGRMGAVMGIAGAVTGNRGLTYGGAGVAAADPTIENKKMRRQGMVGIDMRIVNAGSGRIVGGLTSKGTFTTMSATAGASVFGIGKSTEEFAASALGQATRAAMNDAVRKSTDLLKGRFPRR